MDLFRKTMKPVELVLKDANMKKENIDKVHLRNSLVKNLPRASFMRL
jgi:Hsp70 protein